MIKKILLALSLVTLFSFSNIFSGFKELLEEKLIEYTSNFPEKIYVQTDKPYYSVGEDIWFTAYLVNGINHRRTDKSRVIHVDLINASDSIVSHKQLYTNDISTAGDFKIDKEWNGGNYVLRAYTNYMRNTNQDYFFQKEIPIWNLQKNDSLNNIKELDQKVTSKSTEQLTTLPEIKFYPEGGYLIDGIQSKVGIKVSDGNNKDVVIEGSIIDSDGSIISPFKTYEFGLGLTSFTPKSNISYYASVLLNGQEKTYPLPQALPQGYQISIVNNGKEIILKVTSNTDIGLLNSFLVAHQRGKLIYERLERSDTKSYTITISTATLQDGIANFTLFDNSGKPVCERLVYIDNTTNDIEVKISNTNSTIKTRDQVNLQFDLRDKKGNILPGNVSISVTDRDAVAQNPREENIKTYLLLNSDLRGKLTNPGYFFEKENDPKRRFLLDIVMLTHGWRRFTWNELLYSKSIKNSYKAENGIYISGRTTPLKHNQENISAATRLTFLGNLILQEKKRSDEIGNFKFGPYIFYDSVPTLIEARIDEFKSNAKDNRNISIFLENEFYKYPKVRRSSLIKPNLTDDDRIRNFINQSQSISKIDSDYMETARLLDEVVVIAHKKSEKEKRNELLNERTDYGFPTRRLDLNSLENAESLTLSEIMNQLPGVTFFNDTIRIRNSGIPSIYLDGMQIEMSDISNVNGGDIEFIDVLTGADASFFSNSGNGVIAIHSRIGSNIRSRNIKRKPGIIDFTSVGFYTAREFYAPNHLDDFEEVLKQDIRTTLHWEPKITLTDSLNKANISFFTCDTKSTYSIVIEGITNTGIPVHHVSTFDVE